MATDIIKIKKSNKKTAFQTFELGKKIKLELKD